MSSKAENTFIAGVHKYLPLAIYREKTNNPYRGGTPDVYYEHRRMMWAEYKFIEVPKRDSTVIVPELSELQRAWLQRNWKAGHRPLVIVGHAGGGVVFTQPLAWNAGLRRQDFLDSTMSRQELAAYISREVS